MLGNNTKLRVLEHCGLMIWVKVSILKTKRLSPTDHALRKLVYLAYCNIRKKWTKPLPNYELTVQQLSIKFGKRFKNM